MKCPISGIDCDDCGYYKEYSECFLRELIEALKSRKEMAIK